MLGAIGVYLGVRQKIWSWPIGIAGVTLYVIVFYRARLYADMGLQVVYIVLSFYGWYEWLYGGPGRTTLTVSRAKPHHWIILPVLAVAGAWVTGTLLGRHTDASLPAATRTGSPGVVWRPALSSAWAVICSVDA